MPKRFPTACSHPRCRRLTTERKCFEHAGRDPQEKEYDRKRGTASSRGYGARWRVLRAQFLAANPFCGCGRRAIVADHVVPKRDGGADDVSNLQALCKLCHDRKTGAETAARRRRKR